MNYEKSNPFYSFSFSYLSFSLRKNPNLVWSTELGFFRRFREECKFGGGGLAKNRAAGKFAGFPSFCTMFLGKTVVRVQKAQNKGGESRFFRLIDSLKKTGIYTII